MLLSPSLWFPLACFPHGDLFSWLIAVYFKHCVGPGFKTVLFGEFFRDLSSWLGRWLPLASLRNWVIILRTHDSGCEWGREWWHPFLLIALGRHWLAGPWSSWPCSLDTLESYRPMRDPVVPPTPKGGHLRNNGISGVHKPTHVPLTQKAQFTSFLPLPSPPIVFGVELWFSQEIKETVVLLVGS